MTTKSQYKQVRISISKIDGYGLTGFALILIVSIMAARFLRIKFNWTKKQTAWIMACGIYIGIVFLFTILTRTAYKGTHLKLAPLWIFEKYDFEHIVREVSINIVMFIPIGICIRGAFPMTKFMTILLTALCISLIVETLQLVTCRGAFELDDLLFNTVGAILGSAIARKLKTISLKNKEKRNPPMF